ncbi:uncharacterized protein [Rhodnius prolixus]
MNLKLSWLLSWLFILPVVQPIQTTNIVTTKQEDEVDSKLNQMIFSKPFIYLRRLFFHHPINYLKDVFLLNKKVSEDTNCSNFVYETEYNMLDTLVRELLNNMYVNTFGRTSHEIGGCKKVQNWIEKLINIFRTQTCNNVFVSNKLLDVITVLCKQTNNQIEYALETFRDAMKPVEILANECTLDIINGDYISAKRKLSLISGDDSIRYIVEQTYRHCCKNKLENHFNKILNFFNLIGNARKCFIAYKFLFEQLENTIDIDVWDIYHLYDNSSRIINYTTYPEIKPEATSFHRKLRNKLILFVCEELWLNYVGKNENTQILHEANVLITIYRNYKDIYFDGFKLFLEKNLEIGSRNVTELMEFARSRNFYGEKILGFKAIFEVMELDDNEIFSLALHLKYLSIVGTKSSQKERLAEIKERLPISIKNLLFAESVCIKNVGHNQYLLVNDSLLNNDHSLDSSFTIVQHNKIENSLWTINCSSNYNCDNQFYINNEFFHNYLLTTNCKKMNDCKIVAKKLIKFTNNYLWKVEPFTNYLYIKNVGQNGYIYVNDYNDVSISEAGRSRITVKNYMWYVEDCSNFYGDLRKFNKSL